MSEVTLSAVIDVCVDHARQEGLRKFALNTPGVVPIAVAHATGTAIPKLLDVFNEWQRERRTYKRNLETSIERAERRMCIAIKWDHENRVAAIKAGVPSSDLPVLDFKDKE